MEAPSKCKILLLDGGFASQLTENGCKSIDGDPLWSARILQTHPDAVRSKWLGHNAIAILENEAHLQFLEAGCDIILTNTYQASIDGFSEFLSLTEEESMELMKRSVTDMARPALQQYNQASTTTSTSRRVHIVGCIGPYGAAQHDGSEYHGRYVDSMSTEQFMDWHRPRMKALEEAGVEWFAFETIPAQKEGEALIRLLTEEFSKSKAWLTYACQNEKLTNHGELLTDAVHAGVHCSQITHVGVNCTSPDQISSLLDGLQVHRGNKPFIVYPNSGENWISGTGWEGDNKLPHIPTFTEMCVSKGAEIIGGCCRVTSPQIKLMRDAINNLSLP